MPIITLPDGNSLNFPKKVTGLEIAEKISNGPNLIYSSIKEVLRETENEKEIPSFKILRSLETVKKVYGSQDLKEGASSFVKKTDPKWQDK